MRLNLGRFMHCKYIGCNNYDISSCLNSHRNLVVISTMNGSNLDYSPWTVISTILKTPLFLIFLIADSNVIDCNCYVFIQVSMQPLGNYLALIRQSIVKFGALKWKN